MLSATEETFSECEFRIQFIVIRVEVFVFIEKITCLFSNAQHFYISFFACLEYFHVSIGSLYE